MRELRRRRDVLKWSVLALGALPAGCYGDVADPPALSDEASAPYFPQSVASGDPRPDSVALWVRGLDPSRPTQDAQLGLILALDAELTQQLGLSADAQAMISAADADHCLLVRVGGLEPATTYYYRFTCTSVDGVAYSRVGRTRTAPAEDSEAPVKFAVVCCQDFVGKYFHAARHVAEQDVDFVLHLGDYIYETTGDPSFQSETEERSVRFSAPEEALTLGRDGQTYLAARSLSNYRDLYKLYRSAPDLQALHERHPIIAIWDDHEFSDDSHGDVATYLDGSADETSLERRAAADQAWFEYMPVDYTPRDGDAVSVAGKLDKQAAFPDNFIIYRSFVFGQHLELVLTDLRRFRPDHLVPEDAPPGAVFLTAAEVADQFDTAPADLVPYVELETFADGAYLSALSDNADALGITVDSLTGDFSAVWINTALGSLSADGLPPPIDLEDAQLERGYAYHSLLKTKQFSRIGSRYVVAVPPFEALAQKLWQKSKNQSENLLGKQQREWFLKTINDSKRTFKIWGSEVALQSRHIDLTGVTSIPSELRTLLSISAEDWDGFPNERRALLKELAHAENVLILSGDLHCFFAGTPFLDGDEGTRVVELTTGSMTSTTWLDGIAGTLVQDGSLPMNVETLVQNVGVLLTDDVRRPNPHLAFQELGKNGYSVIEVGPDDVILTVRTIDTAQVSTPPARLKKDLDDLFD
ncbi:MAG TPA: alkaline phosphatase D family protein, partial [Polyangiaceae bacterium]|nr:alkaline phosphatase D family protein [Polyangiaceae bacterium]